MAYKIQNWIAHSTFKKSIFPLMISIFSSGWVALLKTEPVSTLDDLLKSELQFKKQMGVVAKRALYTFILHINFVLSWIIKYCTVSLILWSPGGWIMQCAVHGLHKEHLKISIVPKCGSPGHCEYGSLYPCYTFIQWTALLPIWCNSGCWLLLIKFYIAWGISERLHYTQCFYLLIRSGSTILLIIWSGTTRKQCLFCSYICPQENPMSWS